MQIVTYSSQSLKQAQMPDRQEVHIWDLSLTSPKFVEPFIAELNPEEMARAERYRLPALREKFILARGWLRTILGHYLGLSPRCVSMCYEPGGKPYLAGHPVHFNLSHSGERALIAVAIQRVGIDVEQRSDRHNAESIVERFFTHNEQRAFLSVPKAQRSEAFYRAWTRKEAILKAVGSGVQALEDCEVTLDVPARVLRLGDDLQAHDQWFLHSWDLGDGYEGAVAVERVPGPHTGTGD